MSYENKIKAAKLAARDVLRTFQVNNRLTKINGYEASKKSVNEDIAALEEASTIAVVEAEAMPTAHPHRAKAIENAAKLKEANDKTIERYNKEIADLDKNIADVKAEIASIEAGDGKILVDRETMVEMAKEFVKDGYKDAFVNGDYDTAAASKKTN